MDTTYSGWDVEGMREAGEVASCADYSSPSGFTAINHRPLQLISPPQSSATAQIQDGQIVARSPRRRRNPTVSSYLGFDESIEPAHLMKYAPTTDDQPLPTRKRRSPRNGEEAPPGKKGNTEKKRKTTQSRVSEDVRVSKHTIRPVIHKLDGAYEGPLATPPTTASEVLALAAEQQQQWGCNNDAVGERNRVDFSSKLAGAPVSDDEDELGQLCFDFEPCTYSVDNSAQTAALSHHTEYRSEDEFDDDLMDDDFLDLTRDEFDDSSSLKFQSSSTTKTDVAECSVQEAEPSAEVPFAHNEEVKTLGSTSRKFVSPITSTTRLLAATGNEAHKPITRSVFPAAVSDRSPIIGLSSSTLLRTCFRIGEAIKQSSQAIKTGDNILIELYARVISSERDSLRQRFTFCDLFHVRPPHIQGLYAAAIWKSVELFEYDSARLLQQGRICRCIGTMKRDGHDWVLTVLNIWEATWDDIQWVEGIVNS